MRASRNKPHSATATTGQPCPNTLSAIGRHLSTSCSIVGHISADVDVTNIRTCQTAERDSTRLWPRVIVDWRQFHVRKSHTRQNWSRKNYWLLPIHLRGGAQHDIQNQVTCRMRSCNSLQSGFSAFLYISQILSYLIGKSTNRSLFSFKRISSCIFIIVFYLIKLLEL